MHAGGPAGFPRSSRLKKRADFMRVYTHGRQTVGKYFALRIMHTGQEGRIGIVVSRRYGNAVARNRIKRLLREAYRRNRVSFSGIDMVVIPLPRCKGQDLTTIARALRREVTAALAREVNDGGKRSDISDEKRV